jgi:hypothetical protein
VNNYDALPPLFRPVKGVQNGQDHCPSAEGGELPQAPGKLSADAEIPSTSDGVADRLQEPHLDWATAMSLCLRCGWWGRRHDFAAHLSTDDHCRAGRNEELPF